MKCVKTADPTHIEDYANFHCCYALALLLCARICNCLNFLSSSFVLPVPCYWWTKYQFYKISICQTKPSLEGVYHLKLLLYTQTCTYNEIFLYIKVTQEHINDKILYNCHYGLDMLLSHSAIKCVPLYFNTGLLCSALCYALPSTALLCSAQPKENTSGTVLYSVPGFFHPSLL